MSISMETNTAAIYLRRSTEDDGKSVGQQERELRTTADRLGVNVTSTDYENEDELWFKTTKDRPDGQAVLRRGLTPTPGSGRDAGRFP